MLRNEAHQYGFEYLQWRPASFNPNVAIGERKPGFFQAESDDVAKRKLEAFLQQDALIIEGKPPHAYSRSLASGLTRRSERVDIPEPPRVEE